MMLIIFIGPFEYMDKWKKFKTTKLKLETIDCH